MALSYFYDNQIRRYIEQTQRVFSNFKIRVGLDQYGNEQFFTVPCVYGDSDRMAQHIIRQNSENAMPPVPFMAIYDSDIQLAPERRQFPNHIDKRKVHEREFDRDQNKYTSESGFRSTVERYMPVPYNLTMVADLWFTQTDHKLQVCEQIMTLFNPDIDIQTSTNALDWSGLTTMSMDSLTWNNRGIPTGVDDSIRIVSFTFTVPIWINPPAKVKRQKIIHQIITNIHDADIINASPIYNSQEGVVPFDTYNRLFSNEEIARFIVTPQNHYIDVSSNIITLLGEDQSEINPDTGQVWSWRDLIEQYESPLIDNLSLIRLRPVSDIEETDFDYIGRIRYHAEANKLYWAADLETIPPDSLTVIDGIIDPDRNLPGGDLPTPSNGDRYIIGTNEIRPTAQGDIWDNITANVNDIIEYNGAVWSRVYDASEATQNEYTTNSLTGKKLKFDYQEQEWSILPDGIWSPGYWRLIL